MNMEEAMEVRDRIRERIKLMKKIKAEAVAQARESSTPILIDDSGMEVEEGDIRLLPSGNNDREE